MHFRETRSLSLTRRYVECITVCSSSIGEAPSVSPGSAIAVHVNVGRKDRLCGDYVPMFLCNFLQSLDFKCSCV